MRSIVLGALVACLVPTACETGSQTELGTVLGGVLSGIAGDQPAAQGELTRLEIDAGLREALEIGASRVVSRIGVDNGYWRDPAIRIPLPGRLGQVQGQLAAVGLSGPLDDLQLRMNRAAEQAVPAGKQIVVDAIRSITIDDAVGLLRGGDTAATDFLRRKTEASLRTTFKPYVERALNSSGAYQALNSVTSSTPVLAVAAVDYKSDLTNHAVQYGLNGLFDYLASEETRIRQNPAARTTDILRRVFGAG